MIDLICSLAFALCIAIFVLVMPVNLDHCDVRCYYQHIIRSVKNFKPSSKIRVYKKIMSTRDARND